MNDMIVQQNIILICRPYHIFAIPTKGLTNITFNDKKIMKFHTYIKETINNNNFHQSFQFFLRSWNLSRIILKCSLVHYMIMV